MKNPKKTKELPNFSQRLYLAVLFSLFFAAIFIQIVLFIAEPMLSRDGVFYADLIQNHCNRGQSFFYSDFSKPPLLLIIGSFLFHWTHYSVECILLTVNILAHALLVFPIAYIAFQLFHSRRTAIFCALLVICTPSLLSTSLGGTREPLFMLFATLTIAAVLKFCEEATGAILIFAGMTTALSFFARYEGLFLLLLCGWMILGFSQPSALWKKRILSYFLYLGCCSFCIGLAFFLSPTIRTFLRLLWHFLKKLLS